MAAGGAGAGAGAGSAGVALMIGTWHVRCGWLEQICSLLLPAFTHSVGAA